MIVLITTDENFVPPKALMKMDSVSIIKVDEDRIDRVRSIMKVTNGTAGEKVFPMIVGFWNRLFRSNSG